MTSAPTSKAATRNATWRELITEAMQDDDSIDFTEAVVLPHGTPEDKAWLDVVFEDAHGAQPATPFTLWTSQHVYFPVQYDGLHHVDRVSRQPNADTPRHYGRSEP